MECLDVLEDIVVWMFLQLGCFFFWVGLELAVWMFCWWMVLLVDGIAL